MIVNVLHLTLREHITAETRTQVLAALRRTASVDSVSFSSVGEDFADTTGRTIGFVVGVADIAALERYMHDPVHLAGDELILPNLSGGSALRFATDPVSEQVYAAAAAKAAKYPDWGRRVNELFGDRATWSAQGASGSAPAPG